MIPLSCKEKISYVDDKITWHFKPKTAMLERQQSAFYAALKDLSNEDVLNKTDDFINLILIGWDDKSGLMPAFPADNKPAVIFNNDEKWILIRFWNEANKISIEEKKL